MSFAAFPLLFLRRGRNVVFPSLILSCPFVCGLHQRWGWRDLADYQGPDAELFYAEGTSISATENGTDAGSSSPADATSTPAAAAANSTAAPENVAGNATATPAAAENATPAAAANATAAPAVAGNATPAAGDNGTSVAPNATAANGTAAPASGNGTTTTDGKPGANDTAAAAPNASAQNASGGTSAGTNATGQNATGNATTVSKNASGDAGAAANASAANASKEPPVSDKNATSTSDNATSDKGVNTSSDTASTSEDKGASSDNATTAPAGHGHLFSYGGGKANDTSEGKANDSEKSQPFDSIHDVYHNLTEDSDVDADKDGSLGKGNRTHFVLDDPEEETGNASLAHPTKEAFRRMDPNYFSGRWIKQRKMPVEPAHVPSCVRYAADMRGRYGLRDPDELDRLEGQKVGDPLVVGDLI